jgi:hypothetical protein
MTDQPAPPNGYHCVRCGLDALSRPSLEFLDWEVSCVDDRVVVCPDCMASGQPALDATEAALIVLRDMPRVPEDNAFEADRDAALAAIANASAS